jgi:chorismate mutase
MDKLNILRKKIDALDATLINVLSERLAVVKEIGMMKKEKNMEPLDQSRWNQVLEKGLSQAESLGMRREFIKSILDTIHEEALRIEA